MHRRDFRATVSERTVAAGAIPLGRTNTSELTVWIESVNRVYGRTRNAWRWSSSRRLGGRVPPRRA